MFLGNVCTLMMDRAVITQLLAVSVVFFLSQVDPGSGIHGHTEAYDFFTLTHCSFIYNNIHQLLLSMLDTKKQNKTKKYLDAYFHKN
jgi:hypothetical protein